MHTAYLVCAILGGTILVLQVALSTLGLGLDHLFHVGTGLGHMDGAGTGAGGFDGTHHGAQGHVDASSGDSHHSALAHLGWVLTYQTMLAFVTFSGIGGLASLESGSSVASSIAVATATGLVSMVVLGYLFSSLRMLQSDGTVHPMEWLGAAGEVYLTIPGDFQGLGKAIVRTGGREQELGARTAGPTLHPGEAVRVTQLLEDGSIEVVAASDVEKLPLSL